MSTSWAACRNSATAFPGSRRINPIMRCKRVCACEGRTLDRLLQPAVMAALMEEPQHGYTLIENLKDSPLMDGVAPDPSGVYRLLNALEEQGMVSHEPTPSRTGPDKRSYRLTSAGEECFGKWIDTLDRYGKNIALLVEMMREAHANSASLEPS